MTVEVIQVKRDTFDDIKTRLINHNPESDAWQMLGGEISLDGIAIEADPNEAFRDPGPANLTVRSPRLIDSSFLREAGIDLVAHFDDLQRRHKAGESVTVELIELGGQGIHLFGKALQALLDHNIKELAHVRVQPKG